MIKEYCALCEERIIKVDRDIQHTVISRGSKVKPGTRERIDMEDRQVDDIVCGACWTKVRNCLYDIRMEAEKKRKNR